MVQDQGQGAKLKGNKAKRSRVTDGSFYRRPRGSRYLWETADLVWETADLVTLWD